MLVEDMWSKPSDVELKLVEIIRANGRMALSDFQENWNTCNPSECWTDVKGCNEGAWLLCGHRVDWNRYVQTRFRELWNRMFR